MRMTPPTRSSDFSKPLVLARESQQPATQYKQLSIDEIMPYSRNPRRTVNPQYEEIKNSIRAQGGLNTSLTVTQRPGDVYYTVAAGGNTRLTILKELWEETQLDTYYRTDCLIVPWKSDRHIIAAHLIENELRADMSFIDKARGIYELKAECESELGRALSRNEYAKRLKQMGYPVSPRQLTRYNYAIEFLAALIPQALNAGLGNRLVDRLRKIGVAYSRCLAGYGSTQSFEPLFAQTLLEHDSEDLDMDALQRSLDSHITVLTGQPLNRVRLQVDAMMLDAAVDDESEFSGLTLQTNESISHAEKNAKAENYIVPLDIAAPLKTEATRIARAASSTGLPTTLEDAHPDNSPKSNPSDNTGLPERSVFNTHTAENKPRQLNDLQPLRDQCYELAQALNTDLAAPLPIKRWEQGYGFYLDLPEQPIQEEISYIVFWLLLGLAGQHLSNERAKLAPDMKFAQLLLANQASQAYSLVGSPAPIAQLSHQVLISPSLPETVLNRLFQLIQQCRQIRIGFRESDIFECMTLEQVRMRDHIEQLDGDHDPVGEDDE